MAADRGSKEQLRRRIEDRSARIGIIGIGYVGLPLAVEFAKGGFTVVGFDLSERVVEGVMSGESHIQDVSSAQLAALVRSGRIIATADPDALRDMDAISIAVPTPLAKTRDPDMTYVQAASRTVASVAHPGLLIVLESTTYPGTTREMLGPMLEERAFVIGRDVFLAFSPERVDPGNPVYNTKNTPKVVGGMTTACTELASALYATCIDTIVPVSTPETAELVKLLENTFRSVNIALVNEMAIICEKLGVDVWEVIDTAATKPFGFMKFAPGPGIGGHCIPLDPHYLAWKMRTLNYKTRFIDLASEINSQMPAFVVEKVAHALNDERKAVRGSRVLVMGVAYKRDIDDWRESPALDIIRLLEELGAGVVYHDPHVAEFREDGHVRRSVDLTPAELGAADAVVVVTDHTAVDYQNVMDRASLIIDARNVTAGLTASKARVVCLSAPRSPGEAQLAEPIGAGGRA